MTPPYKVNVSSPRGAPMGRSDFYPQGTRLDAHKLHLRRVPLVDGGYDQGGAYWGCPASLWCAWNDAGTVLQAIDNTGTVIFVRAGDREAAKACIRETLPNARFYR